MLERFVRNYFGFSRTETRGVVCLIVLSGLGVSAWGSLRWYASRLPRPCASEDVAQLEALFQNMTVKPSVAKKNWFTSKKVNAKNAKTAKPVRRSQPFDINKTTAQRLQEVAGIGPVLSTRIVKYRDKLGGFVSADQYTEVYGLSEKAVQELTRRGYVADGFQPVQIYLNTATLKAMVAHPYLSYEAALRIVRYREKHGPFPSRKAWEKTCLLPPDLMKKMAPYLTV